MRRTSLVLSALVVAHGLPTRHPQSAAESTERRIANSHALDAELVAEHVCKSDAIPLEEVVEIDQTNNDTLTEILVRNIK